MSIEALANAMENLLKHHEQLLEIAEQKRQVLHDNDITRLTEMTMKESRLVKQINESEAQRLLAAEAILQQLGLKRDPNLKAAEIVQFLTHPRDKQQIADLADRLLAVIDRLKRANDLNLQLVRQALDFNEFTLDLLTGAFDQDFIYGNPSAAVGKPKVNLFNFRA